MRTNETERRQAIRSATWSAIQGCETCISAGGVLARVKHALGCERMTEDDMREMQWAMDEWFDSSESVKDFQGLTRE